MEGSELLLVCESGGGKPIPQVHPPEFRKPIPQVTRQSPEFRKHIPQPPEFRKPIPPSRVQKTHPIATPPEFRKHLFYIFSL
jgi:hypothetical protein